MFDVYVSYLRITCGTPEIPEASRVMPIRGVTVKPTSGIYVCTYRCVQVYMYVHTGVYRYICMYIQVCTGIYERGGDWVTSNCE